MNLKFVEAFVWVARLGSITRAAKKLCLTQSAISNRIAALEDELGIELIHRRNPLFRLSDAGTRFMGYAEKLLIIQSQMRGEFGTLDRQAFTLRIGAIESVLHTWLIPVVDTLKRSSPLINFELTIETSLNLVERLRRGALDIVFSALPVQEEGLISEPLEPLEMVFIGTRTIAPIPLELDALLRHDILTFQRGSFPHVDLINALRAAGADNKHVHTVSSISALVLLAESGFGVATLPRRVAERLMPGNRIRILETTLPLAPLPLHASYWNFPATPALQQATREAVVFARDHGAERNTPPTGQGSARQALNAPEISHPDALRAESSAYRCAS
ncbi:MAG: LysR family transcriptional regulator [Candidatus Accumulibacter sp.]|jgi:DNA-binding transcriptional LysR family regulator|nr:LysR family transcriptional regulator [Accumulibacter sp.]